jgi:transcriptional regulator with XRE-family HTH domain
VNESTEQNAVGVEDLIERLRDPFSDEEYRNAYAESFLNSWVAAQIKVLREAYPMTQVELAEKIGTQQSGIARLENVNYSAWKVETLRKLARALNVRLRITFEEWGTLPHDVGNFKREVLIRRPFNQDPVFFPVHAVLTGLTEKAPKIGPQFEIGPMERPQRGAAAQACGD